MKTRDLNYWTNRMKEYANKASKHLFVDEKGRFIKIIPFTKDGKDQILVIKFDKDRFYMFVDDLEATTSNSLFYLKTRIFPQMGGTKSVKNFKKAKQFAEAVKIHLENDDKKDQASVKNLTEIIYKTDDVIV